MLEGASRCRPPTGSTPPRHLEGRRRGALQMGAVCTLRCLWQDMSPFWVTLVDSQHHVEKKKDQGSVQNGVPSAGRNPSMALLWVPYAQCPELASRWCWSVLAISGFPLPRPISSPQKVKTCDSVGPIACCRASRPNPHTHPIRFSSTRRDSSGPCSMRCDTTTLR